MKLRRLSLLQEGGAPERYKIHPLIRDFLRAQLREAKRDDAASLRMATYYRNVAVENGNKLDGKEIEQALAILDSELSNIFAGQKWARENATREARELTRDFIYGAMANYFSLRANWTEWIEWSEFGIAACQALEDERGEGGIAGNLGIVYADKGEWDQAIAFYQNALQTMERLGDAHGMAQTFGNLGIVYRQKGEWDQAIAFYQKSLTTTEKIGDVVTSANNYWGLGRVYEEQNDFARAFGWCKRAMDIWDKIGSPHASTYRAHLEELKRKL